MKKVIRLTESDLHRVIKTVIKEESDWWVRYGFDSEESFLENYENVDNYAQELIYDVDRELQGLLLNFFEQIDLMEIVKNRQELFKEQYPQYSNPGEFYNEDIDNLLTANTNLDSDELMDKLIDGGLGPLLDSIFYNKK